MSREIKMLHPWLQYKIGLLKKDCEKAGIKLGIGECFRTAAEQDALFEQGRSKKGKVVTNARGSSFSSQHQWGIAFDVFQNIKGKEYEKKFFCKVAKLAKKRGLSWGGDWKSFKDTPHFYLPKWGNTPIELKLQYGTPDKFKKTWTKKVTKKIGLNIWNVTHTKALVKKVPCGTKVNVMYIKTYPFGKCAKVEYNGTVGLMLAKYLK